jgi:hypothetical protein
MTQNSINLRPMRLVELLDAAFRLYRRNFLTYIGIMALMQVPISLLTLGSSLLTAQGFQTINTSSGMPGPQYFLGIGATLLVSLLTFFLVRGVATAALTRSIAASSLGNQLSILESYKKMGSSVGSLLLSLFLAGLLQLGLVLWTLVPCVGWVSGLGMTFYFGFVIIELIVPVVVLEKCGASATLRRTWELARKRFWWFLGLNGVLYLLNLLLVGPALLISSALGGALTSMGVANMDLTTLTMLNAAIQSLLTMLVSIIYYPLQLIVIILAYFDLRVRFEGFDLALQSIDSAEYPDPVDGIVAVPAATQQKSLITGMEFGYFVAVTLGGALLLAVVYGLLALVGMGLLGLFTGSGL